MARRWTQPREPNLTLQNSGGSKPRHKTQVVYTVLCKGKAACDHSTPPYASSHHSCWVLTGLGFFLLGKKQGDYTGVLAKGSSCFHTTRRIYFLEAV